VKQRGIDVQTVAHGLYFWGFDRHRVNHHMFIYNGLSSPTIWSGFANEKDKFMPPWHLSDILWLHHA
jgi:hypothetical protein